MGDDEAAISPQIDMLERMLTQLYEVGRPTDEPLIRGLEELAAAIQADLDRRGVLAAHGAEP